MMYHAHFGAMLGWFLFAVAGLWLIDQLDGASRWQKREGEKNRQILEAGWRKLGR